MDDMYMKTKKIIMIVMCCLICVMAIGYAAFATNLTINGTANIDSTWDIEFTSVQKFISRGSITEIAAPTASGTTATFNVDLQSPGDQIIYLINIENKGTLDAVISNITATDTGSDAIKFEIVGAKKGDKVKSGGSKSLAVTIEYDSSVTSQPKDTTNQLTVTVDFVQDVGQTITGEEPTVKHVEFIGDKYTVGSQFRIKDEYFYIISVEKIEPDPNIDMKLWYTVTSFKAIAKYNLDVDTGNSATTYKGTGKQDSHVLGTKEGVPTYGGISYSDTEKHLTEYKNYLERLGVNITSISNINETQLKELGCSLGIPTSCTNAPNWLYSSTYWTTWSAGSDNNALHMFVESTGGIDFTGASAGVRPVIELDYTNLD